MNTYLLILPYLAFNSKPFQLTIIRRDFTKNILKTYQWTRTWPPLKRAAWIKSLQCGMNCIRSCLGESAALMIKYFLSLNSFLASSWMDKMCVILWTSNCLKSFESRKLPTYKPERICKKLTNFNRADVAKKLPWASLKIHRFFHILEPNYWASMYFSCIQFDSIVFEWILLYSM